MTTTTTPLDLSGWNTADERVRVWLRFRCGCEREAFVSAAIWRADICPARCPAHSRPVVSMVRSEGA